MTISQLSAEKTKAKVLNLDLSKVERRLVRVDGYTEGKAREAIETYRQFLVLKATYPDRALVPPVAADHALHAHILHTRQYAKDTQAIFSGFMHHDPEETTDATYDEAREFTRQAFLEYFGVDVAAFEFCMVNVDTREKQAA